MEKSIRKPTWLIVLILLVSTSIVSAQNGRLNSTDSSRSLINFRYFSYIPNLRLSISTTNRFQQKRIPTLVHWRNSNTQFQNGRPSASEIHYLNYGLYQSDHLVKPNIYLPGYQPISWKKDIFFSILYSASHIYASRDIQKK
jgi:hypothetical protein